jgi:quercetin dioxygenase-like cupin family protein
MCQNFIVVDGKLDLTIDNQTKTYSRGDTYYIPANTLHKAKIYPGYRAIDWFADKHRYKVRSHNVSRVK